MLLDCWKAPIWLSGDLFSPIQPSLSDNFSSKTIKDGLFGLDMASKEILLSLFNHLIWRYYSYNWKSGYNCYWYVWKNTFPREWIYGILWKHFVYFQHFLFLTMIIILLFLLVYISLLPSLPLLKLILLSFLPLLFIMIIQ